MPAALAKKHRSNGLLTASQYMALPDDGNRYELVHGELLMSPSARFEHHDLIMFVGGKLQEFAKRRRLGRVGIETDVIMGKDLVLRPDICFIGKGRESIIRGHIY